MYTDETNENGINAGDIAAIAVLMLGIILNLFYQSYIGEEHVITYAIIYALLTIIMYPLIAWIIRHVAMRKPIPKKRAYVISVVWCTVMWILDIIANSVFETDAMVNYPILWIWIDAAIMYCGTEKSTGRANDRPEDIVEARQRAEDRMEYLIGRYKVLKEDIEAVKPEDIHAYYTSGKITEDEYNEIANAYQQAVDEMQEIYREYKQLRGSLADK